MLGIPTESHPMKRIAIVGGGPGGLFTARLLTGKLNDGIDITLFEASRRRRGSAERS